MKADNIVTAEETAQVRKTHKALLEDKLAAVSSFEPAVPTSNDQWQAIVWPASGKAKKSPDTGVPEQILRDVGKASVTISSEGFVRFLYNHPTPVFSHDHDSGNPSSSETPHQCPLGKSRSW